MESKLEAAEARCAELEAELSRLREQLEVLAEAQPFPVETVMSWKRQVDDAKRRSASALLLLDPDRQDERDEENTRRAFEILSGLRPPTFRPDRERAVAAEARCAELERERDEARQDRNEYIDIAEREGARCARLRQTLADIKLGCELARDDLKPELRRIHEVTSEALEVTSEALAGPDTPADICPECGSGLITLHVAAYPCSRRNTRPPTEFSGRGYCECEARGLSEQDECLYDNPCSTADSTPADRAAKDWAEDPFGLPPADSQEDKT